MGRGGGGGVGANISTGTTGDRGGLYGGGGGGGSGGNIKNGGAGAKGIIVITYTPAVTPSRTLRLFEGFKIKFVSGKIILHQK